MHLFILHEILLIINILSNKLQEKTATLGNASEVLSSVILTLKGNRCDEHFYTIWNEITQFATKNEIVLEMPINGKPIMTFTGLEI